MCCHQKWPKTCWLNPTWVWVIVWALRKCDSSPPKKTCLKKTAKICGFKGLKSWLWLSMMHPAVLTPFHALSDVVGTNLGFDGSPETSKPASRWNPPCPCAIATRHVKRARIDGFAWHQLEATLESPWSQTQSKFYVNGKTWQVWSLDRVIHGNPFIDVPCFCTQL